MSQRQNVLSIDAGTQSVRAFVFDPAGNLVDSAQQLYDQPYQSPRPGWAEQDPRHYWAKTCEVCHKLWAQGRARADSLASVALTSQRGTVINLDQEGRPLRPAILWLDQRRASRLPDLPPLWNSLINLTGLKSTVRYLQAEAEINWILQYEPEVWKKTAHYLLLSGYLNNLLTGEYVDSVACTVGYLPFDYKKMVWEKPSSWKWQGIQVRPETLPDLVPPGSLMGKVTPHAARLLGVEPGLPVVAGASDKACEVLGCGCLQEYQGCIGYGTTATLNVNSPAYHEPVMLVPPYPSAQAGAYNLEFQIFRGFWMVTWFKEQFAQLEAETAMRQGMVPEQLLEDLARTVPAGSLGLTLQPYWTPGVRNPGVEAKGAIIGFGSAHQKQHMYRAMLEGLAYGLRYGRGRIEKKTHTPISSLMVCGGGSRSDLMLQITADVFNLPVTRPAVQETSGLGAAMLAALGAGLHPDVDSAVSFMCGRGSLYEPGPDNVAMYDELYNKVYRKMYGRLRGLYKHIMHICGYPELP